MLRKYLDDLFFVLYGEKTDCDNVGFSKVYTYECQNIVEDFDNWLSDMKKYYMPGINETEIAAMLIYFEQQHIGSDLSIRHDDLQKLALVILKDICD